MLNLQHPLYKEDITNILSSVDLASLAGKRVLVTGATGLIGSVLIDALMQLPDVSVIAVGRNESRAHERFGCWWDNSRFTFLSHNVCDPFPAHVEADVIIPMASNTHPLAYSTYPVETMLISLKGMEHALNLAQRCGATVLCSSTVEVYGNARGEDVFTEEYTGNLNLSTSRACYTEAKRASEALCLSYMAERNVDVKIGRLCRVFGPSVLADDSKASSQFLKKSLAKEDIVLKSKGNQFFSYIYVADAVSALLHILIHGVPGVAYNISNEKCDVRLRDFAQACAAAAGTKVVFDLPSEAEAKGFSVATKAILDNARLRSIGWNPVYDFQDAINRTIQILS